MKFRNLTALLVLIAICMLIQTQILAEPTANLEISAAWVRPSLAGQVTSAAYLRITNHGSQPDQLLRVTAPGIAHIEIHQTTMDGETAQMHPVYGLEIAPGTTVSLEPMGLHLMLMGIQHALNEGDTLLLTLHFASGAVLTIEARIAHSPEPQWLSADVLTLESLSAQQSGLYVGQIQEPPLQVQDFVLPGSHEDIQRLSDLNGTWRVIFFGYMHCPDFCPLTLVEYKRVKELLAEVAQDVTFVFISVDPIRDSVDALREYLARFDPAFIGFSGDDATLTRIQPDYGFYYARRMGSGTQSVYTIDHSTRSYLLDRDGVLRASFAYDTHPDLIASALRWYMAHE